MLRFSKRLKSSLVKAQSSGVLNNVVEDKKSYYELADYQTQNLKEYFDKQGLMFPVETIIEKYKTEDYDFFLNKGNFMKVCDTLEKFGNNLDMQHEDAKNFVLFKKKLYKLYEVRSRSSLEHSQFSTEILEDELTHVYDAHRHHLAAIREDNRLARLSNQFNLKGAYYKRKFFSPARLRGITSGALALSMYMYYPYIATYCACNIVLAKLFSVSPIAASLYGLYNLSENNVVHRIQRIDNGQDEGKIRISVAVSPIITRDIIAHPKDILDGGRVGTMGYSALKIQRGYDVYENKDFNDERIFAIETHENGNVWIDQEGMDWLLQKKEEGSQTDDLYADLVHQRAKDYANYKREKKDLLQELRYVIER